MCLLSSVGGLTDDGDWRVGIKSYELRIWLLTKTAMTLADVTEENVRSFGVYAQQPMCSS